MRRIAMSLIVVLALVVLPIRAAEKTADLAIDSILRAKSPSDAEAGFRALYAGQNLREVRALQLHAEPTIAIQSAWQEVELSLPEKSPRTVGLDAGKVAAFVGFLEGRGRVQAPAWWTEALLGAQAHRRGSIYVGDAAVPEKALDPYNPDEPPLKNTEFVVVNGKPMVRIGDSHEPVPADLPEALKKRLSRRLDLSVRLTDSRLYLGNHEPIGYSYRLACVDRAATKSLWTSDVWACYWHTASGSYYHKTEILEQGDRIVVFGIASTGFYVEAFNRDNGANLFRFSNAYVRNWGK